MTLPCIICKKELESIIDKDPNELDGPNHPLGALCFHSYGQYGTTVFDPMDDSFIEINICDNCLRDSGSRGEVLFYKPDRRLPAITPTIWRP